MHPQAFAAVRRLLQGVPTAGARVLELGSYDVNGSVRPLFVGAAAYVGLDVRPGPGVDVVGDAATWAGDGEPFDLIISTEMLEHTPDPQAVIANAARLLAPGGWLVLTAAGPERMPHGCDGQAAVPTDEAYTPIDPDALLVWLDDAGLDALHLMVDSGAGDVYARAQKPPTRQTT